MSPDEAIRAVHQWEEVMREWMGARSQPPAPIDMVEAVQSTVSGLAEVMADYDPDEWREAVLLLWKIRQATGALRDLDATVSRWLYLHGEHGQHQHLDGIPGEFAIGRGRSKERWEAPEAIRDYIGQKIKELGGEYPDPDVVVDWVLEVLPATPSSPLRKTPLRQAGLELEDYYHSEPGAIRVDLPRT